MSRDVKANPTKVIGGMSSLPAWKMKNGMSAKRISVKILRKEQVRFSKTWK